MHIQFFHVSIYLQNSSPTLNDEINTMLRDDDELSSDYFNIDLDDEGLKNIMKEVEKEIGGDTSKETSNETSEKTSEKTSGLLSIDKENENLLKKLLAEVPNFANSGILEQFLKVYRESVEKEMKPKLEKEIRTQIEPEIKEKTEKDMREQIEKETKEKIKKETKPQIEKEACEKNKQKNKKDQNKNKITKRKPFSLQHVFSNFYLNLPWF